MPHHSSSTQTLIQFEQVSKYYGNCRANDGLDFLVKRGTIHAVIGENGAGKSTAMKMLFGMEKPTAGRILLRGQETHFSTPREAMAAGIGMVHQHFMLSSAHTALDNILVGVESKYTRMGWLPPGLRPFDRNAVRQRLEQICRDVDFKIPWDSRTSELAVGIQQQIEIVKLLFAGVDIMIFDEPTAVLSPQEIERFMAMLDSLKKQGKTILIITHKLREVKAIADNVTVMRKGKTVATRSVVDVSPQDLADLMVGRQVQLTVKEPPKVAAGDAVLKLTQVSLDKKGKQLLKDVSLTVHAGEIVGVAGVEGNGQSELLHLLYDPAAQHKHGVHCTGEIRMLGENAQRWSSLDVRLRPIGVVPADRHREGVLLSESLAENNILGHLKDFSRKTLLNRHAAWEHAQKILRDFDVRPAVASATMADLSGGNQQKFVMARELSRNPKLLLCAQPTRGVDVGSIEQIHQEILSARTGGMAILLVSSQLDELMQLSDRLVVFYGGRVVAEFTRGAYDEQKIGLAMGGGHHE